MFSIYVRLNKISINACEIISEFVTGLGVWGKESAAGRSIVLNKPVT